MPPMISFEFGDIVLVRFPFTDQSGSKQRPAVVVSSQAYHQARADVILMAVTSQVRQRPGFGEIMIHDWQAAGLLKASAIKPVILTAEKRIVTKQLGRLKQQDQQALREVIGKIIG